MLFPLGGGLARLRGRALVGRRRPVLQALALRLRGRGDQPHPRVCNGFAILKDRSADRPARRLIRRACCRCPGDK